MRIAPLPLALTLIALSCTGSDARLPGADAAPDRLARVEDLPTQDKTFILQMYQQHLNQVNRLAQQMENFKKQRATCKMVTMAHQKDFHKLNARLTL